VRISRASKTPYTIMDWREPPRAVSGAGGPGNSSSYCRRTCRRR
jgi:hypothetical protein